MKIIYDYRLVAFSLLVLGLLSACSKDASPVETPKLDTVKVPITMVTIPGGTFTMGCTSEQIYCDSTEKPTHQVTLSTFEISRYEITQYQWRDIIGTNPSDNAGENKPVDQVTWYDAVFFCNMLSRKEGLTSVYTIIGTNVTANWDATGYRLPTEAEWEYAARGGASSTNTRYSGSNTIGNVAWYSVNSRGTTNYVGTKSPNELGIYDMSGNISEWCWDLHGSYSSSSQTNPKGSDSGFRRVYRGGGYGFGPDDCRVSKRAEQSPGAKMFWVGFRIVRTKK